jgi:hypothetical protein
VKPAFLSKMPAKIKCLFCFFSFVEWQSTRLTPSLLGWRGSSYFIFYMPPSLWFHGVQIDEDSSFPDSLFYYINHYLLYLLSVCKYWPRKIAFVINLCFNIIPNLFFFSWFFFRLVCLKFTNFFISCVQKVENNEFLVLESSNKNK